MAWIGRSSNGQTWIGQSFIGRTWRRLKFLLRRSQLEQDLAEEMRLHAELKALKNVGEGMAHDAAYAEARRQLGNVTQQCEASRQSWGFPSFESIVQDVRYGTRGLRNSPGFSGVAIITLALGIGATTAIFSVVNTVLLRPLPFKDSSRLVVISTISPLFPSFQMGQSIPNLNDIRSRAHAFEMIAAYQPGKTALTGEGTPQRLESASVTWEYFPLFSIHPLLGREMLEADGEGKSGNVVWLSQRLWRTRYAGDRDIIGRAIALDQQPYEVVGVMPEALNYPDVQIWKPLTIAAENRTNRQNWMYFTLARLRPEVPAKQGQAELDGVAAQIAHENPKEAEGVRFLLESLQQQAVKGSSRRLLLTLLTAVGFLLLIACANVSNLILSRSIQRRREIAVRAALGAGRLRILRQLLIESLVLSLAGGFCGLFLAVAGVRTFRVFAPADFARLDEVVVSPVIMLLALSIASVTALICGMLPAIRASRADLILAVKENSRSTADKTQFSLRNALAVTEIALALVLLTGAALMAQSIVRQLKVDTGFRTDHIITAKLQLSQTGYAKVESQIVFIQKLLSALRSQPGLSSVGISNNAVMEGSSLITFDPAALGLNEKTTNLQVRSITPGFFETMGVGRLAGRFFSDRDVRGARRTVVINEAMMQRYFGGKDPVGRILKLGNESTDAYEIIGVAANTRDIRPGLPARPQIYFALLQDPMNSIYIVARSQAEPSTLAPLLQNGVWSVDKDIPLTDVRSMTQVISATVSEPRFHTWLLIAFAGVGMLLTLIGIYGVVSYSVSQRTHEMGIRIALGAIPRSVMIIVLKQGAKLAITGAVLGLVGSLALTRFLGNQLYEIKPGDPVTLTAAALLMLAVAVAASYIPARRATRVDPMIARRHE